MLSTPELTRLPAHQAAVIRMIVPRSEIRKVMGPGMSELNQAVASQGVSTAGPMFTHHFRMDPNFFDFEIGVPVASPITPSGRVQSIEIPALSIVRAGYTGPYSGLSQAWREFDGMCASEDYLLGDDLWESYVTGPESHADPDNYYTELYRVSRFNDGDRRA